MSVERHPDRVPDDLWTLPEFGLACLFDDVDEPSSVTIFFPRGERTASEWITSDLATAVSLDAVR